MPSADALGVGLYTIAEAARLLETPRRTLSRWVEGYVHCLRGGMKAYKPVVPASEGLILSFGDLVELLYVRGFRQASIPLDHIRQAAAKYRQEWAIPYPFATKRFALDGKSLLLQEGVVWRHALSGQFTMLFDELGTRLVHVGDLTTEWRPLGKDRAVTLHPGRSFGKPIEDRCGALTSVLVQALGCGETPEKVAWWYGTTVDAVLDAQRFEKKLQKGTHGLVAA